MTVKISNSGRDERGKYSGGKAGDQGGEWTIRENYDRPWNRVLRLKDRSLGTLLAQLSVEAAENDKIGYDQSQRETYWAQLKKAGYRPSKVKAACEADCSAGVCANLKAVGYLEGVKELQQLPITSTHYMRSALMGTGLFYEYTSSKYTGGRSEHLMKGDVLLNDQHHTAVVVSDGSMVTGAKPASQAATHYTKGAYRVTASELNVREGDTVRFPVKKVMKRGQLFKVTAVSGNWGYIPSYDGWTCLDYAERQ